MKQLTCQIVALGLLFITTTALGVNTSTQCKPKEARLIQTAILAYVERQTALHANDVTILKLRCSDQYASAILHPKQATTDDATVYLHKKNQWDVLSLGTAFDPDFLKQIPQSIR